MEYVLQWYVLHVSLIIIRDIEVPTINGVL